MYGTHLVCGQGSCLVRADDCSTPKRLDREQSADNGMPFRWRENGCRHVEVSTCVYTTGCVDVWTQVCVREILCDPLTHAFGTQGQASCDDCWQAFWYGRDG